MALGNGARVAASNVVSIGNSSVKVGLAGVSNPVSVLDLTGDVNVGGMAAPSVSASGAGKIYFDSTANKFRVSENAGSYVDLISASSGFVNNGNSFGASATLGTNDANSLNFEANNSTRLTILSTGQVGIGTTDPGAVLDVIGSSQPIASTNGILAVGSNDAYAINKGGTISFGGKADASPTTFYTFGMVGAFKENGSSGNTAGYLAFGTVPSGSNAVERMRIDSTGKVGIGTTNPNEKLEVNGNIRIGSQATRATASNRGQLALGSTYTQTTNVNAAVDWSYGNIQEINTFVCDGTKTITMSNVKDGAAYTLLLSGTAAHSGTCVFSAGGFTFKTSGGAAAPTASKDVLFTFAVINNIIVYSMTDNLQ